MEIAYFSYLYTFGMLDIEPYSQIICICILDWILIKFRIYDISNFSHSLILHVFYQRGRIENLSKKLLLNHPDVLYFYTLKKSGSSKDDKTHPHETIWFLAHKGKHMLYLSSLSVICLMNWGKSKNNNPRKNLYLSSCNSFNDFYNESKAVFRRVTAVCVSDGSRRQARPSSWLVTAACNDSPVWRYAPRLMCSWQWLFIWWDAAWKSLIGAISSHSTVLSLHFASTK